MSNTVDSITGTIERLYQGFFLRDILGFTLPGIVTLAALWQLVEILKPFKTINIDHLLNKIYTPGETFGLFESLILLGLAYTTGWMLQAIHHSVIDWLYQIILFLSHLLGRPIKSLKMNAQSKPWVSRLINIFWPIAGIFYYIKQILEHDYREGNEQLLAEPLTSRAAMAPDRMLIQKIKAGNASSELINNERLGDRYTERLSALLAMAGNLSVASLIWVLVIYRDTQNKTVLWGLIVVALLYLEHWRLWYIRNLRHEIYVRRVANSEENEEKQSST